MADVWVILAVLGFFGVCVVLVWGCDRIIGPDELEETSPDMDLANEPAGAR